MNASYQPASRSARSFAAIAAVATAMALFDFVAGLGDAKSDVAAATAEARANAQVVRIASVKALRAQMPVAQ